MGHPDKGSEDNDAGRSVDSEGRLISFQMRTGLYWESDQQSLMSYFGMNKTRLTVHVLNV